MRRTKKLYTIIRANNGEVVASDLVLQDAINVVGCKYKEVLIQKASEGKAYKGFRIIQKHKLQRWILERCSLFLEPDGNRRILQRSLELLQM